MNVQRRRGMWLYIAGAIAPLVLGIATTVSLAATGALRGPTPAGWTAPSTRCSPPPLAGHVVDVTVGDMGGVMGGPRGLIPPGGGPSGHGMGMMWLRAAPSTVPAGTVSLRVFNGGALTHDVVVLPLPSGRSLGERPVGSDGKVGEVGGLGEASRSCGAGAGAGLAAAPRSRCYLCRRPGVGRTAQSGPGPDRSVRGRHRNAVRSPGQPDQERGRSLP